MGIGLIFNVNLAAMCCCGEKNIPTASFGLSEVVKEEPRIYSVFSWNEPSYRDKTIDSCSTIPMKIMKDDAGLVLWKRKFYEKAYKRIDLLKLIGNICCRVKPYKGKCSGGEFDYEGRHKPVLIFSNIDEWILKKPAEWLVKLYDDIHAIGDFECYFVMNIHRKDCGDVSAALKAKGFVKGRIICFSGTADLENPAVVKQWNIAINKFLMRADFVWFFTVNDLGEVLIDHSS